LGLAFANGLRFGEAAIKIAALLFKLSFPSQPLSGEDVEVIYD
jgi:hypothetical protein